MKIDPHSLAFRAFSAAASVALLASAASAQARLDPEQLKLNLEGKPWMTGFVTVLILALVLVGAFLKSKRGHQD